MKKILYTLVDDRVWYALLTGIAISVGLCLTVLSMGA